MTDTVGTNQARKYRTAGAILLLLAVLSSPLGCCGCAFILNALPTPFQLPMMDLFKGEAQVENRSGETVYLTPITMTYGYPIVIGQPASIRQRDFPLQHDRSIVLTYDTADAPLSGIAVCRADGDCRLLDADRSGVYYLDSFDTLPRLKMDWLLAIQSHPTYSFNILLFLVLSLLPVVLFSGWLYFARLGKKALQG